MLEDCMPFEPIRSKLLNSKYFSIQSAHSNNMSVEVCLPCNSSNNIHFHGSKTNPSMMPYLKVACFWTIRLSRLTLDKIEAFEFEIFFFLKRQHVSRSVFLVMLQITYISNGSKTKPSMTLFTSSSWIEDFIKASSCFLSNYPSFDPSASLGIKLGYILLSKLLRPKSS